MHFNKTENMGSAGLGLDLMLKDRIKKRAGVTSAVRITFRHNKNSNCMKIIHFFMTTLHLTRARPKLYFIKN